MNEFAENIKTYLEVEETLNRFFEQFDYCVSRCIQKEQKIDRHSPSFGCCKDKYYKLHDLDHPSFELLRQGRERLYGKPEEIKPASADVFCEYHTPKGCLLKSHKSPTCLSFLCKESIDFLRENHKLFEYDYIGVYYALEWILTGDLFGDALEEFKAGCVKMAEKIKGGRKTAAQEPVGARM